MKRNYRYISNRKLHETFVLHDKRVRMIDGSLIIIYLIY